MPTEKNDDMIVEADRGKEKGGGLDEKWKRKENMIV